MKPVGSSHLLAAVFLTMAWVVLGRGLWGAFGLGRLISWTIIGWAIAWIVFFAARRLSPTLLIGVGATSFVALMLPDALTSEIAPYLPQPLKDPITLAFLFTIPSSFVISALLTHSGLTLYAKSRTAGEVRIASQARGGSTAIVGLSAVILAIALRDLYRFMVWDTTADSLGMLWLALPILSLLFSCALLMGMLPGRARLAGLSYLLLIPLLIPLAACAQTVDFRQLTLAHAEQVRQEVEAFELREGRYPQSLSDLPPWQALTLPAPMILYGQRWCYQGGDAFYRLGYLDRDHWSSPIQYGRVFSARGHSPLRVDVCQEAIAKFRAGHSGWDRVLQDYGKPTPISDIGT